MDVHSRDYGERARRTLEREPGVRDAVTAATLTFDAHRREAFAELDADAFRAWAEGVKSHALTHLDRYLEEAEARLVEAGARVHWAETREDVHRVLGELVDRVGVRTTVKAKSMLGEEMGVTPFLEGRGVEVFETDLGEYVIQLLGEEPSHIVGPAIHRSLADIRALFHERLGTDPQASPGTLARAARAVLRRAFLDADLGISGCNFLVAETGSVALIENEGNIRLSTSLPRVHVALVGIEKVIPRWSDLAHFLQLTARAATGQPVGSFVSVLQGPRPGGGRGRPARSGSGGRAAAPREDSDARYGGGGRGVDPGGRGASVTDPSAAGVPEPDGPEELHVVLVDAGRTRLLADPEAWETLRCIRCGACLNVCPVYRQTGGHAYGFVYSGPIGAVLAPGLAGLEATHPLPFASSLCGACADVCPVRIPIPRLLLEWRRRAVEAGLTPASDGRLLELWAALAARPGLFGLAQRAAGLVPPPVSRRLPVLRRWAEGREPPRAEGPAFRRLWEDGIP